MNKKGFTMIEVLAVIVIIALIAGIGTVAYTSIMAQVANKTYERYRDTMHAEAIYYVTNSSDKVNWSGNTARLSLTTLQMEPIDNPKNSSDLCSGSYVDVTRSRVNGVLSMTYNVCLKCNDFDECKMYEN